MLGEGQVLANHPIGRSADETEWILLETPDDLTTYPTITALIKAHAESVRTCIYTYIYIGGVGGVGGVDFLWV